MAVLWCGGEDINFPNGAGTMSVSTTAGNFRSGYGRCAISNTNTTTANILQSQAFPGGAVTSAWLSVRLKTNSTSNTAMLIVGFGLSGTSKGLFVGTDGSSSSKWALAKYDGSTRTQLAAESGTTYATGTSYRIDMQVISYGASATVNVYKDGTLIITYTGDVTVSGMTNFDTVSLPGVTVSRFSFLSEFIVASEDLRAWPGLVTLALTGAGTTTDWTATYSNINGTTISDANPGYTNTSAKDHQFNVTDLPAGTFRIQAVMMSARMAKSADATPGKVSLGYNNGGTIEAGTAKSLTTSYANYEQLDSVHPGTSDPFIQSEMNAIQLNLRSAA